MTQPAATDDLAQYDGAVHKGLDTLTNIRKKADEGGGAGTGNSNDILDQGEPALVFFDRFSPVYQAVSARFGKTLSGDTSATFVRRRYDEQRDIDFDNFAAEADAIRKAGGTQQDQARSMADKLGDLWHGWAGSAANASRQSFVTLNQGSSKAGGNLNGTAQVISDTTRSVSKIVTGKATNVLHSIPDRNSVGGMTPDQARDIVDVANGDKDDDKIKRACSYFNVHIDAGCDDSYKQQAMSKAGDWVSQVFCPHFEGAFHAVTQICDDTKKAVDDAWKVLTDHLAQTPDDPFADAQGGRHPEGGSPGRRSGAGSAPGGDGGGGAAAGGAATVAGGATAHVPQADTPGMPGNTGADSSPPGSPQTVTLGSGDDSVPVGQPDQQGPAEVTLTGADGQPKTDDVAFGGAGRPAMAAPAGSPQAPSAYQPVDRPLAAAGAGSAPVDGAAPTFAQAAGFSSVGGLPAAAPDSFGSASGQLPYDGSPVGAGEPGAERTPGAHAGATGLGTMQDAGGGSQHGAVGLQSMADPGTGAHPETAPPAEAAEGQSGNSTMMGPMGPMGGMGHGGGGKQRSNSSPWRTEGQLFDDGMPASDVRFRSVLGAAEEEDTK